MKNKLPINFRLLLDELKAIIRLYGNTASAGPVNQLNGRLTSRNHDLGKIFLKHAPPAGWTPSILNRISMGLKTAFKDIDGLSPRNFRYMRDFAAAYPHYPFLEPAPGSTIPFGICPGGSASPNHSGVLDKLYWTTITALFDKVKDHQTRLFYIHRTIEHRWSRDKMVCQIRKKLHNRVGRAQNNFIHTLPSQEVEEMQLFFRDPYDFSFICPCPDPREKDIEDAMAQHLLEVLEEFGPGISFTSRQLRIYLGHKEYIIDQLMHNTHLNRNIIVDLKTGAFRPEYVSKMNMYQSTLDNSPYMEPGFEPSIGLILCQSKNDTVVEYALRNSKQLIAVATYTLR